MPSSPRAFMMFTSPPGRSGISIANTSLSVALNPLSASVFWASSGLSTSSLTIPKLSPEEIVFIVTDLHAFVEQENGIDYLQVYQADDGRRIWCIDQLRKSVKDSGEFTPKQLAEYDHWTMLLPEEY